MTDSTFCFHARCFEQSVHTNQIAIGSSIPVTGQADILMVTDGEIPMPKDQLLDQLGDAKEDLGLELHGLLVGRHESKALQQLTTHLHVFKSWSTVKASKYDYA